jgi:hypothetical protein
MTKREAMRWVCARVSKSIAAGLIEDEATESLSEEDQRRVNEASTALHDELKRRAGEENERA